MINNRITTQSCEHMNCKSNANKGRNIEVMTNE